MSEEQQELEGIEQTVDLSAIPETHREYVDTEKYQADEDYKQAIEHGWKPLELHQADGGDPADYTGYRQFNRRYQDRQELKGFKSELSEIKTATSALVDTFEEQKQQAIQEAIAQKEAQVKQAVEDGETDLALSLTNEISDMKAQPATPQQAGEPQEVLQFRAKNPVLDANSPKFNATVNAALEAMVNQKANALVAQVGRELSTVEINSILNDSWQQTQQDLSLEQPKPKPAAPAVSPPGGQKVTKDPVKTLSDSGKSIYNMIKGKYGEEAAANYAKKLAGQEV